MDLHNNQLDFISRRDAENNQCAAVLMQDSLITMLNNVKQMNQAKHLSHQLSSGWRDTGSTLITLAECVGVVEQGAEVMPEVLCRLAFHCSTITDMEGNDYNIVYALRLAMADFFSFFNCSVFNELTYLDLGPTRCWLSAVFLKQLHLGMRIT